MTAGLRGRCMPMTESMAKAVFVTMSMTVAAAVSMLVTMSVTWPQAPHGCVRNNLRAEQGSPVYSRSGPSLQMSLVWSR